MARLEEVPRGNTGPVPRPPLDSAPGPESRVRWGVLLLLFTAAVINFVDRQVIALVKQPVSTELGWSDRDYANVVSGFLLAYALGLAVMGRLSDRLGVKRGLSVAVVVWSIAACAQGAVHSTLGFLVARLGLGFGEGGNFPTSVKATGLWFPPKERALAVGLLNTGSSVGAMAAPLCVPWITVTYGWRMAFFVTGSLGFLWLAVWWMRYHESQGRPQFLAREPEYTGSERSGGLEEIPLTKLVRWRSTWAFVVVGGLLVPIWVFYLFWLPDFLQRNHGLT